MIMCTRVIEDACIYLWQAMNGRTYLEACPFELLSCLGVILDAHNQARFIPSRRDRDLVSNSLAFVYAWFTTPKSKEDIIACVAMKCLCPAENRDVDQWHRNGEQTHAELGYFESRSLVSKVPLWSILTQILQTHQPPSTHGDPNSPSSHRSRVGSRWPTSLAGLIPHGPQDTVRGLQQWFLEETPSHIVIRTYGILSSLLQLCHPLVMPYIAQSPDFILHTVIRPIERMGSVYCEHSLGETGQPSQYHDFVTALYPFLRNLTKVVGDGTERIMVFDNAPQRLLDSIVCVMKLCKGFLISAPSQSPNKVTPTINLGEVQRLFNDYFLIALEVAAECSSRDTLESKSALHGLVLKSSEGARFDPEAKEIAEQSYTIEEQFSRLMVWLRLDDGRVCLSPVCNAALKTTPHLRRCGGCERVYYCSRPCQKRAWTHDVVPHRLICSELRFLRNEYLNPDSRRKKPNNASSRIKSSRPPDLDKRAQSVLDHFKKISEVKLLSAQSAAQLSL